MYTPSPDFDRLHNEFAEALLACRTGPRKKAVHRLRTGTRRLEALLNKLLEDHAHAKGLHTAGRKALRELKRVRQAAGPVRDLDVHRTLASELSTHLAASIPTTQRKSAAKATKRLRSDLKQQRRQAAKDLQDLLAQRELKLQKRLDRFAEEMNRLPAAPASPLKTANQWVAKSAANLRHIDENNLHDFRKRTKSARYLAGLQTDSTQARRLEQSLKDVQDAIGRWHDLLLLHQEAESSLGGHAGLTEALAGELQTALQTAHKVLRSNTNLPAQHRAA